MYIVELPRAAWSKGGVGWSSLPPFSVPTLVPLGKQALHSRAIRHPKTIKQHCIQHPQGAAGAVRSFLFIPLMSLLFLLLSALGIPKVFHSLVSFVLLYFSRVFGCL
jgi:hypothetical protein